MADDLTLQLQQQRCKNSKIHWSTLFGDGDSSPWFGWRCWGTPPFHAPGDRGGPQLAFCLWALCRIRNFFKPLTGENLSGRKKCFVMRLITPSPYRWWNSKLRPEKGVHLVITHKQVVRGCSQQAYAQFRIFFLYSGKTERRFSAVLSFVCLKG